MLPGGKGEVVGRVTIRENDGVAVRLFHYIEGDLLERVPFQPDLLFQLGIETARLTAALSVSYKSHPFLITKRFLAEIQKRDINGQNIHLVTTSISSNQAISLRD